jgi:hypothetical protein
MRQLSMAKRLQVLLCISPTRHKASTWMTSTFSLSYIGTPSARDPVGSTKRAFPPSYRALADQKV